VDSSDPASIVPPGRRDAALSSRGRLLLRLITFNIASIDGRIALSRSAPSWLDARWKPLDRYEPVEVMSLHGARVYLEGSNSFTARCTGSNIRQGSSRGPGG
jgi:hypothetical protein